jgi:hypothetical protein
VFNDYARRINELKEKDKNLDGNDIREGLTAVISVRIPEELLPSCVIVEHTCHCSFKSYFMCSAVFGTYVIYEA